MRDLSDHDAVALAGLVQAGEVSPRELVDAAIARAERLNPALNAIVTPLYDQARRDADGPVGGPLAGVPMLLKDIHGDVAGVETRNGSRFMAGRPATQDHTLVQRYRAAGLIFLGKSNVPELGMNPITTSELYGPARNPWDLSRTPGGSTGGGAAAVAAGIVPIAHGGDAGGSLRMPAACCGLVGLKPSRGRTPAGPVDGELLAGFLAEHVLTRTVRDSAAVLDCTHGAEPGDPYAAPPAPASFAAAIDRPPARLRIAVSLTGPSGESPEAPCREAVEATVRTLAELGHEVVAADPPDWAALLETAMPLGAAWVAHEVDAFAREAGRPVAEGRLEPRTWALYAAGKAMSATDYLAGLTATQTLARRVGRFMDGFDAWLSPTLPHLPPVLGPDSAAADPAFRALAFVLVANATGQPSVSLPLHWTAQGLPVGVMLTGRFGDDAGLLRLAAQLEAARPWRGRRPPLPG